MILWKKIKRLKRDGVSSVLQKQSMKFSLWVTSMREKEEGYTNALNVEENLGFKDTDQQQKVCTKMIYTDQHS